MALSFEREGFEIVADPNSRPTLVWPAHVLIKEESGSPCWYTTSELRGRGYVWCGGPSAYTALVRSRLEHDSSTPFAEEGQKLAIIVNGSHLDAYRDGEPFFTSAMMTHVMADLYTYNGTPTFFLEDAKEAARLVARILLVWEATMGE